MCIRDRFIIIIIIIIGRDIDAAAVVASRVVARVAAGTVDANARDTNSRANGARERAMTMDRRILRDFPRHRVTTRRRDCAPRHGRSRASPADARANDVFVSIARAPRVDPRARGVPHRRARVVVLHR